MIAISVTSEAQLAKIAAAIGQLLEPGSMVSLSGPIGAGKTTFIRYAVAAIGSTDIVRSPTYTVAHTYDAGNGEWIAHLDLYRNGAVDAQAWADLEPTIEGALCTFVEWPQGCEQWMTNRWAMQISLEPVSETARVLRIEPSDDRLIAAVLR